MSLDDELRKRMQAAADQAGAGFDPAATTAAVSSAAASSAASVPLKLIAGLGLGGLAVGAVVGFTALAPSPSEAAPTPVVVAGNVQTYSLVDCPGGAPVALVRPGDRVFTIGRDEDGAWLAVRLPDDPGGVGWLALDNAELDRDDELPVLTCATAVALAAADATSTSSTSSTTVPESTTTTTLPESTTTTATTPPVTTARPAPTTAPATVPPTVPPTAPPTVPPTAPPDTQQPTIQASANPPVIAQLVGCGRTDRTTLTALAQDNVGVANVVATWTVQGGGTRQLTRVPNTNNWTATFGPISYPPSVVTTQVIPVTIRATDAAGNSRSVVVNVTWEFCLL